MIKHRIVYGETGNIQGHVGLTAYHTLRGAQIALGRVRAEYGGKGQSWGRVEMNIEDGMPGWKWLPVAWYGSRVDNGIRK